MRTNIFLFILAFLYLMPMYATASEGRKIAKRTFNISQKTTTRLPLEFDFEVTITGNCLQITFEGILADANILITDNAGEVVWKESAVDIYQGKVIRIDDVSHFPFTIEIESPTMDVIGEISLE